MNNFDKVQFIKSSVKMKDILEKYGIEWKKRIPCPLHGGTHPNFSVTDNAYMCFSKCGGGDVINFVEKLFGLTFAEALKKIDSDFSLGLYKQEGLTFEELRKMRNKAKAQNAKMQAERMQLQKLEDDYWNAFDDWKEADDNMRYFKPKTPEEEWEEAYIKALRVIDFKKFQLEVAEERLRKLCYKN